MKSAQRFAKSVSLCLFCLLVLAFVQPMWAQDEPQMSAEEEAMMQAMIAAGTPGEAHAGLAKSVGSWTMSVKSWMDPAAEPMVTEGSAERHMTLDGRVLVEEASADMMGMPFTGYGMTGYDNVSGKYWSTWNDSMSTGIGISYGTYDAESDSYTYKGEYNDPMTGGPIQNRAVILHKGDTQVMEYFETRGGVETKTMEIVYTRK